jgi:hypothetical protein
MFFPKASAVLLYMVALSEVFSIPEIGYHLAVRSPQNFRDKGNSSLGGSKGQLNNKAQGSNNRIKTTVVEILRRRHRRRQQQQQHLRPRVAMGTMATTMQTPTIA